jgi:outer membrane protein assembly factor BamB
VDDDRQLEERLRRLSWPADRGSGWAGVETRAGVEPWAIGDGGEPGVKDGAPTRARKLNLRLVLYAALAVVIVAAIAVGSLEAVKHLGKDQPIVVITDDTTGVSPGSTGQTTQSAPSGTAAAMFGGNAARTGVYPSGGPTERPDLLWKLKTGEGEGTSPVVSDGVVYVSGEVHVSGDDVVSDYAYQFLYALDARSGQEKWRFPWSTNANQPSCPAVSDGLVYIGGNNGDKYPTTIGSKSEALYALDAESGREIWKFRTSFGVTPSPAVSDGLVYFGTDGGYLYALDAASGQLKWDYLAMDPGEGPAAVDFSPAVSDGAVYFTAGDYLYALDAQTGQEKWTLKLDDVFDPRSSLVVSDGVVYLVNDARLQAFDAQTGQEEWTYEVDGAIWSSPAVSDGVVYFLYDTTEYDKESASGSNALAVALDATTGKELWQFAAANDSRGGWMFYDGWSSPSISGKVVYFGTAYEDGRLHALDALTGEELWTWVTSRGPDIASSSPAISDGVVYFSGTDGYLYALK